MPFVITKNGIPFARVEPFSSTTVKEGEKKESEICKHGMVTGVCRFGCK